MAEARPDVMAARSGAAIARANLNLSRAARTPDVQAGPIYSTADNGTQYLGFRLQRDIGLFNNGSALASQRETELYQQILAHRQLARRAADEAAAAIDRYERARRFVAESDGQPDESPADELAQVVAQFEAGKTDIVSVLGIQNNLLMDLCAQLDLINEVAQSAALVTQATGLPPERLLAPPRPEPLPPAPEAAGTVATGPDLSCGSGRRIGALAVRYNGSVLAGRPPIGSRRTPGERIWQSVGHASQTPGNDSDSGDRGAWRDELPGGRGGTVTRRSERRPAQGTGPRVNVQNSPTERSTSAAPAAPT